MDIGICGSLKRDAIISGRWGLVEGKLSAEVTTNFGRCVVFEERVAYPVREKFIFYKEWTFEKTDQSDQFVILGGAAYRTIVPAKVGWFGNCAEGEIFYLDEHVLIEALGPPPTT